MHWLFRCHHPDVSCVFRRGILRDVSQPSDYPGARLGLPQQGPGSIASFGRRLVAIAIDWALCQLIVWVLLGGQWGTGGAASFAPLAVFALENILLVSVVGYTVGHRMMGIAVLRLSPDDVAQPAAWLARAPGLGRGIVRTALLCLALPALVTDAHGRGWHDRLAGTVILRQPRTR